MRISDWSSDVCSSDLPQCQYSTKRQGPAPVARRQPDIDYTVQALARTEGSRFDQKRDRSALADDRTAGRVERGCSGHGIDGCFRNVGLAGYPVESSLGSASFAVSLWLGHERSEEHTSELQSLMRISYAVFCLKKTKEITTPKSI